MNRGPSWDRRIIKSPRFLLLRDGSSAATKRIILGAKPVTVRIKRHTDLSFDISKLSNIVKSKSISVIYVIKVA